ncbi:MAG: AMP-binding protein [Paracoccaceae bacterium]
MIETRLLGDEVPTPLQPRLGMLLKGRENALFRPVTALLARELGRIRGQAVPVAETNSWTSKTAVNDDEMGVDSLALLELVAAINRIFLLHRTGVEDYLLIHRQLGEWCEIIANGFRQLPDAEPEQIVFETSGSTGVPKQIVHSVEDLVEEVSTHPQIFGEVSRAVAQVPAHHIYGFLFTVLSPLVNDWLVLDLASKSPGALAREGHAGDLIIGTPFTWGLHLKSGASIPAGCTGVTSTAPAPSELWPQVQQSGLGRLVEVYGSTETLGVGLRDAPDAPFEFLPHVRPVERSGDTIPVTQLTRRVIEPPDQIKSISEDSFQVLGRKDSAIQIGGVNVFTNYVEQVLRTAPGVARVAVRQTNDRANRRLKAFIVPEDIRWASHHDEFKRRVAKFALENLSDPERPVSYRIGEDFPVSIEPKRKLL